MSRPAPHLRHAVVCGTDFTSRAGQAAAVAARLAVAWRRPLLLVHVTAADPGSAYARRLPAGAPVSNALAALDHEATRLRALGATVVCESHQGHADEVLVARARACRAEVIVVGAIGTRRRSLHPLGNIAERTAEAASVPTLVVRDAAPFERWLAGDRPLKVVLGVTFTTATDVAVDWVDALRRAGPCDVTAGHVNWPADDYKRFGLPEWSPDDVNSPRLQALIESQVLDRVRARLGEVDLHVSVAPARGDVPASLVALALDGNADLVVVGARRRQGLARLWAGSVSRAVLSDAPMTVAVVPAVVARDRVPPIPRLERVLVATELWPGSRRAVAYACGLVRPPGVLRLVHVTHPRSIAGGAYETSLTRSDRHRRHVRELGQRLDALRPAAAHDLGVHTEATVVECDDVATGICQEAERFGADVVVVGTTGAGLRAAALGPVAERVIARSARPVLVVRGEE